ncbi:multiple epidermal growth factor-like domains protein 10 [Magallana gigas]|uniref:multiple epidermal growth factor-like domains protein 10 n=1 Tax=Magallana gigas TaxID=29159 RepID=UPI003342C0EF
MLCEWKSLCVNMGTFLWTTLVCFFSGIYCFENLSRRNTTVLELSSTYDGHGVTLANDGDLALKEWYCSHTDPNRPKAWLQVDLGQSYSISNVKIYYRTEDSWKQYRFRQFYLDVSEFPATTSNTSQRTRCYTDNTTEQYLPPNIIDMPCQQTARYVIVETTYDAPEDNPTTGAMLEICEIEIYENECETGRYGDDCRPCWGCQSCDIKSGLCDCPDTCYNQMCDKSSGQCIFGCQTGYWDFNCSSSCSQNCLNRNCSITNGTCDTCIRGRYGDTCHKMCSPGCVSQSCDRQSGACSDGCRPYWAGEYCDTCDSSHYGPTCSETCSINCKNGCRPDNGDCLDCVEGMFGSKCNKTCGPGCVYGCDQFTGQCTCKQGSQNDSCVDIGFTGKGGCNVYKCISYLPFYLFLYLKECNPDYYGVLCDKQCSPNCNRGTCSANNETCDSVCKCNNITKLNVQDCPDICNNKICDKLNGYCTFGCQTGYWDFTCSSSCSENCLNRNCSFSNGTCDTCIRGRYGDTCDDMCSPGCVSQSCDRQSGACSDGCKPYWAGEYCDSM